jgi:hypoxanthine phosphoribosyltransferase
VEDVLQARIREMGSQITLDYAGRQPTLICVLKGAMVFMGDLMRSIDLRLTIDFIAVSSYGKGTNSSGEVKIVKDLDGPLEGRDIILVEDILDTGLTLSLPHAKLSLARREVGQDRDALNNRSSQGGCHGRLHPVSTFRTSSSLDTASNFSERYRKPAIHSR